MTLAEGKKAKGSTLYRILGGSIQTYTDKVLEDDYFTKKLLPKYQREVAEMPGV